MLPFVTAAFKEDGEFKDVGEAVKHLETKMAEFKTATTKEAEEKALAEAKKIVEAAETKSAAELKKLQDELTEKGATIAQIQVEFKELKAKGGRIRGGTAEVKTIGGLIYDAIGEHREKIIAAEQKTGVIDPIKMETKDVANISSSNLTGGNYINFLPWQPGMEPTGQTRFRDIFPTFQSEIDFVNYPRAKKPVGEGSFGRQATEGATKAQVDRDYEMITLNLKPMAGFSIVSRQALRNVIFLQSWLPTSLMESLMDAEDTDFANLLIAAATGSNTTTQTLAASKLITYIKNLRKTKYAANAIMIDPDVWEVIINYRSDQIRDFNQVVTVDANGNVRILGRPVYDVNWLTGGRVVVGDTRKAGIIQSEGLTLRQSDSHKEIFTSNETAFLLERTEGLAIFRPDAFVSAVLS